MTPLEFLIVLSMFLVLFVLRFGIPMLVMAIGRLFCCRVLHLNL
jgi:hypothetical protein